MTGRPLALTAAITRQEACNLAEAVFPKANWVCEVEPTYYRLFGVIFRLHSAKGPTRKLHGQEIHVLVDPRTRRAWTADNWEHAVAPAPAEAGLATEPDETEKGQLIRLAQEAVYVRFLKRFRLAASFECQLIACLDTVYKPNWYAETPTHQLLIDGLTGHYATALKAQALAA